MPIPYNCFGTGGAHRRWIVTGRGPGFGDMSYMWSDKLIPEGPSDWVGPTVFPQLPDLGNGYNMSQIVYDEGRDMFAIVGTLEGIDDSGQPDAYPNWSPYLLRSFDLMETWESEEIPLHVPWLNVEPGLWGNGSVGHLHYDPVRRRLWMFGGFTENGTYSRPDTSNFVSWSDDGGETWEEFTDIRADPGDFLGFGHFDYFVKQQGDVVAAGGGDFFEIARIMRLRPGSGIGGGPNFLLALGVYDHTDIGGGGATNDVPADFIGDNIVAPWLIDPEVVMPSACPGGGWVFGSVREEDDFPSLQIHKFGDEMWTRYTRDISEADPDLLRRVMVSEGLELNKYFGVGSGDPTFGTSVQWRFARSHIAGGRLWSFTGGAGFGTGEYGQDQLTSSPDGENWRADQDFSLPVSLENEFGGWSTGKQHPFFSTVNWPSQTAAIHGMAQSRSDPNMLMCVGRIAGAARFSHITNRFFCYSMSFDGGDSWTHPYNFPDWGYQPYEVWSV